MSSQDQPTTEDFWDGWPFGNDPEPDGPRPRSASALVGTGDPWLDELNRIGRQADIDGRKFFARSHDKAGIALINEARESYAAGQHTQAVQTLKASAARFDQASDLLLECVALGEELDSAVRDAAPDSSRRRVVPNDNRLGG